ncbi:hypothetical protein L6164_023187 [Bauhinia variegata]|uniref:Uncharacterized protein n=1 Tax=Bauhinia variegata TaxID=167791 RepID=A0ACB9MI36_BAUVA|nr:hypothetical protein L6164_023187 [Bauhinia variegata]
MEINAFQWVVLIAIYALLLKKFFKLLRLWYKGSKIPGSSACSHCPKNLTELLSEEHKKYGSIVKLWLGPTQLLVSVNDPVLIRAILEKAEDKLPFTGKAFRLAFGPSNLFASSSEKVRKRRELLTTELNERLLENNYLITKVVDIIMDKLENIKARGSLDSRLVSQHMAFSIMGSSFFGDGFLTWPKAAIYEELLMLTAKDACFWASYNVTPFWKQGFWKYQCLCKRLKCLTQDILQHCKKNCKLFHHIDQNVYGEKSNIKTVTADGAQCCSGADSRDCFFFHKLNDNHTATEEPSSNIMRVIFHGCQQIEALIANVLTMLAMHPEIQDKVYSEITMAMKQQSKYEEQDVYRMPLLLATVFESARLMPSGSLLQRCPLKHDLSFENGVTIPAGAILAVPVNLVQTDDSNWGSDATDFNPYRFLSNVRKEPDVVIDVPFTGSGEESTKPGFSSLVLKDPNENAAFLPFGSGRRTCVGQKFVVQVVASLFASLLKKYEIRPNSGSEVEVKLSSKNHHLLQHLPCSSIVFVSRDS